jgi:tRNA modification GTPase
MADHPHDGEREEPRVSGRSGRTAQGSAEDVSERGLDHPSGARGDGACGDTIAAIATPPGRGGIGIVRVSGAGLHRWGPSLIGHTLEARRPQRVRFLDAAGAPLDDGLALYFPAPQSYTGEDVLELHGHGGPIVMRLLLARCLELGARIAEPGEFTRRAFLNDKLDLAQAESVADLIDASTERAARSAMRSLTGEFSRSVTQLKDGLVTLRALVEATLDFPEEDIDAVDRADARGRLAALRAGVDQLLASVRQGALLRAGLHAVLSGQPNVGKSSLLNRLAGEDVAIVTPVAGTTRDALRQAIELEGVPLHLIDTAGLRDSADPVERIGVERSWKAIGDADVVVLVVDARDGVSAADEAIVRRLPERVPRLIVHNKIDLLNDKNAKVATAHATGDAVRHVRVSARTGEGMELLRRALLEIAGWQEGIEDVPLARERHVHALVRVAGRLAEAERVIASPELFAEELRLAQRELGTLTGEFTADDLLGEIFSRFCIGK